MRLQRCFVSRRTVYRWIYYINHLVLQEPCDCLDDDDGDGDDDDGDGDGHDDDDYDYDYDDDDDDENLTQKLRPQFVSWALELQVNVSLKPFL